MSYSRVNGRNDTNANEENEQMTNEQMTRFTLLIFEQTKKKPKFRHATLLFLSIFF